MADPQDQPDNTPDPAPEPPLSTPPPTADTATPISRSRWRLPYGRSSPATASRSSTCSGPRAGQHRRRSVKADDRPGIAIRLNCCSTTPASGANWIGRM